MQIVFASGGGHYPEMTGGVQSSTDHLVRQCIANGHKAALMASLFGNGLFGLKTRVKLKLSKNPGVVDLLPGYPVIRAWHPQEAVGFAVQSYRPDVAVIQCHQTVPIAKAFEKHDVPVVVYLRNVEFEELGGDLTDLANVSYIANSKFTAARYQERYGFSSTVIPPTIQRENYQTKTTAETVTFINVYPEKGFDLACKIAEACPKIPFLFLESWKLSDDHRIRVEQAVDGLENVTFERRTSDMKSIYGKTKILLAPSKWEEAWGRVASEAHCSGIPVVGSTRGGLPEAIGPGGYVLDYDAPVEEWVAAIERLWNDKGHYDALSRKSLEFAARPQLDPTRQFEDFIEVLCDAAQIRAPSAA